MKSYVLNIVLENIPVTSITTVAHWWHVTWCELANTHQQLHVTYGSPYIIQRFLQKQRFWIQLL